MNLRIAAGQEFASFVGNVDFGEKRTRSRVDRFRSANNAALEFAAGELGQLEMSREARTNRRSGAFRNIYVDANGIRLREREQELGGATVAGVDECSGIDIAASDHTAKRGVNVFKGFKFIQATNIRLRRSDGCLLCGQVSRGVVHFLL